MVHTISEFAKLRNLEFHQHLGSHKHVINIIMGFRGMECFRGLHELVGLRALTKIAFKFFLAV
jgi:hypothetical protein